jgi:hypothetical protein
MIGRQRVTGWTYALRYSFGGYPSDGVGPYMGVVIGADGVLYGSTGYGRSSNGSNDLLADAPGISKRRLDGGGAAGFPTGIFSQRLARTPYIGEK